MDDGLSHALSIHRTTGFHHITSWGINSGFSSDCRCRMLKTISRKQRMQMKLGMRCHVILYAECPNDKYRTDAHWQLWCPMCSTRPCTSSIAINQCLHARWRNEWQQHPSYFKTENKVELLASSRHYITTSCTTPSGNNRESFVAVMVRPGVVWLCLYHTHVLCCDVTCVWTLFQTQILDGYATL